MMISAPWVETLTGYSTRAYRGSSSEPDQFCQFTRAWLPFFQTTEDRLVSIVIRMAWYAPADSAPCPTSAVAPCCSASTSKLFFGSAMRAQALLPVVSASVFASIRTTCRFTLATESYGKGASVSSTLVSDLTLCGAAGTVSSWYQAPPASTAAGKAG